MLASFLVALALCCVVQGNEGEIAYFKTPQQIHLAYTNDPTRMAVSWFTKDDTELLAGAWYGVNPQNLSSFVPALTSVLSDGSGHYNTAIMRDLEPGTSYHYYVGSRHEFFSDIYSFRVPKPTDPVKIIAFGDMGTFPRGDTTLLHELRVNEVHPYEPYKNPSMILQAGDLMYPFGNQGMIAAWFDAMQKVGSRVPFMVAPGNRDQQDLIQERFEMPKTSFGDHPEPQRHNFYYSFDLNFVHFVVISTNFDAFQVGSPQHTWLKNDLRKAKEAVDNPSSPVSWIVLMGHTPIYSSSDGHTQGNHELKAEIETLIKPVTLCLWGDDHVYERSHPVHLSQPLILSDIHTIPSKPASPIHVTIGTGGIDNDGWAVDQPEWSAVRFITKGYLSIQARRTSFSVAFTDRDSKEVMDYFEIHVANGLTAHPLYLAGGVLLMVVVLGFCLRGKKKSSSLGV